MNKILLTFFAVLFVTIGVASVHAEVVIGDESQPAFGVIIEHPVSGGTTIYNNTFYNSTVINNTGSGLYNVSSPWLYNNSNTFIFNETHINTTWWNSMNDTITNFVNAIINSFLPEIQSNISNKASPGECPSGQVVNKTTTSGVTCVPAGSSGSINETENDWFRSYNLATFDLGTYDRTEYSGGSVNLYQDLTNLSYQVHFDQTDNQYMTIANDSDLNLQEFSVEGWFKVTNGSSYGILHKSYYTYDAPYYGWEILDIGGTIYWRTGITGVGFVDTNGGMSYDAWHHVVVTHNTTEQYLYIDGAQFDITRTSGTIPYDANPLRVGTWFVQGATWYGMSGDIDELRFYNYALTQVEVNNSYHYNGGTGYYGTPSASLVAGYHFDEGVGTTTADYSTNKNHQMDFIGSIQWEPGEVANAPPGGTVETNGTYISKIFDAGNSYVYGGIDYGGNIENYSFRSCDDAACAGDSWKNGYINHSQIISESNRYFQWTGYFANTSQELYSLNVSYLVSYALQDKVVWLRNSLNNNCSMKFLSGYYVGGTC